MGIQGQDTEEELRWEEVVLQSRCWGGTVMNSICFIFWFAVSVFYVSLKNQWLGSRKEDCFVCLALDTELWQKRRILQMGQLPLFWQQLNLLSGKRCRRAEPGSWERTDLAGRELLRQKQVKGSRKQTCSQPRAKEKWIFPGILVGW